LLAPLEARPTLAIWQNPRRALRWLALLAGVAATFGGSAQADQAPRSAIVLNVAVDSGKGRVLCGLYERNGWLKRPLKGSVAAIRGGVASCRFGELKPGTYAAGAFQDENSNGRLDRNFMGMPKEPWCVSRGPRGTVGPPSFGAASFSLPEGTLALSCHAS
jgi:uncharacterized protein (DUF2141 family)